MVRDALSKDVETISAMAVNIFTNSKMEELNKEFEEFLQDDNVCLLVKEVDGNLVGFAHIELRFDYVEGCESSPVGYLEGIYIKPNYRNKGYAKELLVVAEKWAKGKGAKEFASDCELSNTESLKFHLKLGFKEENRIICFKKNI
ncbi:MAG: GNAT family N-acetyltransferase [Clostridia bacterium]|nr:GNAT family N-acetyltransferase [Clostridia bacterium]